jgi:hypothetical protein
MNSLRFRQFVTSRANRLKPDASTWTFTLTISSGGWPAKYAPAQDSQDFCQGFSICPFFTSGTHTQNGARIGATITARSSRGTVWSPTYSGKIAKTSASRILKLTETGPYR